MNYWLIKSEPFKYAYEQLLADKETTWDGVRNYGARNNLRDMKKGDMLLFYHSNEGLAIVGTAVVSKEHFKDPTSEEDTWLSVKVKPGKKFRRPVSLAEIKKDKLLSNMELVRLSRLSVSKVSREEFDRVLLLSES
jgi:predicted RNA-binding protein with PUA-like domain